MNDKARSWSRESLGIACGPEGRAPLCLRRSLEGLSDDRAQFSRPCGGGCRGRQRVSGALTPLAS